MQAVPHPDLICGLADNSQSFDVFDRDTLAERTWSVVRAASDALPQHERFERLRRLRQLLADAHQVRESGHVYDLGERLSEVEFGHNFSADSRYVSELPMEVAYIHFGYNEHMLFGDGRWIDGVYIRDDLGIKGAGMLFTFVADSRVSQARQGSLRAGDLVEVSNCASAFVPADADPRFVLHNRANYRGEPMLAQTIKIISGAEIALYALSMLSPLRPMSRSWSP